jgi:hypothetical protein
MYYKYTVGKKLRLNKQANKILTERLTEKMKEL